MIINLVNKNKTLPLCPQLKLKPIKPMKKIYVTISLLLYAGIIMAQSITPFVIASTGNFSTAANFTLSSTLGEVMVKTETGTNNILTQGFHQPGGVGTSIQQIDEGGTSIVVYPNPATDHLTVKISSDQYDRFNIELIDLPGQEIFVRYEEDQYSTNNIYTINTSALAQGIYMLHITSYNNEFVRTIKFKIIK